PSGPGRHRARQANIEQTSAAWCQPAFAPGGSLVPPAVTIPRVSREREQTTRWGHRPEVEWHSRPMQIHCRFEQRFVFAFPANRRNYDRLWTAAASETFLDGMRQSGVSAELQPNIYSKVSDRVDRRRKLHRLPDAAAPVRCIPGLTSEAIAGDGAE